MEVLSLNGEYRLYSENKEYACTASVPGSDFGNLMNAGLLPDVLNVPDGERIAEKAARNCFIFEREFDVDEKLLKAQNAVLFSERLDTLAKVFVNSALVLTCNNAHISYEVDIKKHLVCGTNTLKICFSSSLEYIENRQKARPLLPNSNGVDGAQYLRKPNCHFGWDWGPCVPYNYCGNIQIKFFNREITDIRIRQVTSPEHSTVTVSAQNADECYILSPSGERIDGKDFVFEIDKPELWYTRDLSLKDTQPLYTVVLKNGEMTATRKIGLRDIRLNTEADEWGNNFQFVLNGKRVFAKGANVIPFAAIPEYADNESVEKYLQLAVKSNFNTLRIWGGGEYASDYLLSRCDELGILIWHDFCFACLVYPFDENDFVENIKNEAKLNIARMDYHPCLALWCGNNEIEECNLFTLTGSLKEAYIKYFYETLPKTVKGLSDIPYIPTSPVGKAPFTQNTSENIGDSHMWSVWHGLMPCNFYSTRYARFLSEFGMESLPSKKAIRKFAPNDKSVYSKAFFEHQKCNDGNRKLMYYLGERFSGSVSFEDLPYLTGIAQAECIKAATEHFRRNKGRCNGSVFWQFNDVWNAPSWSAVDFEKVPKALMYKAAEFFAPITLTYDGKALYLHNDTMYDKKIELNYEKTNHGRLRWTYSESVIAKSDSVTKLHEIELGADDLLKVSVNGKSYLFDNIAVLQPVKLTVKRAENELIISSDSYAKNVFIDSDSVPEDNYFSLAPGEEKRVGFDAFPDEYSVTCENNLDFSKGKAKIALFRFFYRFKPQSIAQYVWYKMH